MALPNGFVSITRCITSGCSYDLMTARCWENAGFSTDGRAMSTITLILCHGTDADFKGFVLSECNDSGAFGRGFYFSNDMELERQYSNGLDPVVAMVRLQNPYILDKRLSHDEWIAATRIFRPIEHARERLIGMGYDGVLLLQDSYIEVVAFYPRQIQGYGRRHDLAIPESPKRNIPPLLKLRSLLGRLRTYPSR